MTAKLKIAVATVVAAGLAYGGTAIAGGDDDATEKPITGSALQRAERAALAHTGGGRVSDTEVGDEEGAYEVEVLLPDGGHVDVHLDTRFEVLGTEGDDGESGDE